MAMERLSHKSEIESTFSSVRSFSFQEKKSPLVDEEYVNKFLDTINEFKAKLKDKTDKIQDLNHRMEELTWYDNVDDDCLMVLNDLISAAKDLRSSLIRQYVSMGLLKKKGIGKAEIKDLKSAIDDLKETYEDLESVFFYLPEMPNFKETTKKLSLV